MSANLPGGKWYYRGSSLFVGFLLVGPLILPLVWANPGFSGKKKAWITAAIAIVTVAITAGFAYAMKLIMQYYKLMFCALFFAGAAAGACAPRAAAGEFTDTDFGLGSGETGEFSRPSPEFRQEFGQPAVTTDFSEMRVFLPQVTTVQHEQSSLSRVPVGGSSVNAPLFKVRKGEFTERSFRINTGAGEFSRNSFTIFSKEGEFFPRSHRQIIRKPKQQKPQHVIPQ